MTLPSASGECDGQCCSRAVAAEDDLTALRLEVHNYCELMASPDRGNVIYRRTVVEDLERILDG